LHFLNSDFVISTPVRFTVTSRFIFENPRKPFDRNPFSFVISMFSILTALISRQRLRIIFPEFDSYFVLF
jgi:hypothetical protein